MGKITTRPVSSTPRRFTTGFKAVRELGLRQVSLYLLYQAGLRTGLLRLLTRASLRRQLHIQPGLLASELINLPDIGKISSLLPGKSFSRLLEQADQVRSGMIQIFAGENVSLVTENPQPLQDWTQCKLTQLEGDVKLIWEPGRFAWVYTLGMAYLITGSDEYPQAFWELSTLFFEAHPPYNGWQWVSAQEVALRLISLVFASQAFAASTIFTQERQEQLARWIALHAARIPPTLVYARSQNNNHLLSEAAGLFSAGMALLGHPDAGYWRQLGWSWFVRALQSQISKTGAYIQHSSNYHRLMLQLVLWMELLRRSSPLDWPDQVRRRIQLSIRWLADLLDPVSGQVPNLGPNDGSYILPLTQQPFEDYRPVLQAVYRAFYDRLLLPAGPWDDFSAWLGLQEPEPGEPAAAVKLNVEPLILHHSTLDSWGYLRAARFTGRPGHADQLHLDLWWQGQNIALDPGTYQYNASPPWDNALAHTAVHNTLSLANREQMKPAGRFLYLDWVQAEVLTRTDKDVAARHDGYRSLGLWHQRRVEIQAWGWRVEDQVMPVKSGSIQENIEAGLHWLLPDWAWQFEQDSGEVHLDLESTLGSIRLIIKANTQGSSAIISLKPFLLRAGKVLFGEAQQQPTWGWYSPTYGLKYPALALGILLNYKPPFTLESEWWLEKA